MNVKVVLFGMLFLISIVVISIYFPQSNLRHSNNSRTASLIAPPEARREIVQYPLNPDNTIDVDGQKLPEFLLDVSESKFEEILSSSKDKLGELVSVNVSHTLRTANINTEVTLDKKKKMLMVAAKDIANFKPGLYKVSLTLRTIEGEVNIEQDFSWGVLAVNTKKSVYQPQDVVKIGLGVLDDGGNTQCLTGFNHLSDLNLTITTPDGREKKYGIADGTIKDSGLCSLTSVTNEADFQAEFSDTQDEGVYKIYVEATVKGTKRSIVDYFKVDSSVEFDVERTSFPTRIYPFSPYPVTFKIISKQDYDGEVADIVPAFFEIKNASGDPILQRFGDFTKIIWNVNLKAGEAKEFTYFINFPKVSPEFYLVGPIKVGNFQEARQWQIASDAINSTSGLLTYEDNGGPNTYSQVWTGTIYNSRVSMSSTPADSRWFKEIASPKTGEKIVALIDNDTTPNDPIYVFTWDGDDWGGGTASYTDETTTAGDATRPFDIAYEELSGDVLLVYSDYSSSQLLYARKPAGGAWPGSPSNAGTAYDTYKRWVRLEGQFGSDSILVGYLNNNERVGAMIWDGSSNSFGDQFADNVGTVTATSDEQAFDIAWETNSGTPMVFWGTTGNLLTMREFTGGTWQAESTVTSGFTNDLDWVFAASDPVSSSNNISLALQDGTTCDVHFGVWTGAAATMWGTTPACPSAATNNLVETAFENDTSQAMFVYVPDEGAEDDNIAWLTWTSGGGFVGPTTESQNIAVIESLALFSDLNTTSMMLLFHDNSATCDLYSIKWDGSDWSTIGTAEYGNMCASADDNTLPYGFGFDRNLEKQVAYRWFANSGTVAVSSAIGATDTPALLTSANQQFRLRLLIYTPDSLTSTSFRDYKLQYVEPGTGTCDSPVGGTPSDWTDVPTSGGSTISFYNNATPSDGDNLTVNGSLDPTFQGLTINAQDYEEANNFTNSVSTIDGDELGLWDFSLVDNTTFDRVGQTFCFRVARSNDVVLRIGLYPQISTAAVDDVLIQGGTQINQGTSINNP